MYGRCILKNNGFTLLETLGAFIVFVILISISYSLLLKALNLRQRQQDIIKGSFVLFRLKTPTKTYDIKSLKTKCYIFKYRHLKTVRFQ